MDVNFNSNYSFIICKHIRFTHKVWFNLIKPGVCFVGTLRPPNHKANLKLQPLQKSREIHVFVYMYIHKYTPELETFQNPQGPFPAIKSVEGSSYAVACRGLTDRPSVTGTKRVGATAITRHARHCDFYKGVKIIPSEKSWIVIMDHICGCFTFYFFIISLCFLCTTGQHALNSNPGGLVLDLFT